jgi:Cu+-exporting ATPase
MAVASASKDPVCGMTVVPETKHRYTRDGQEFLFCSSRCRDRFIENPTKFIQPERPKPVAAAEWTCPMHPQIVRPGPGSCPICGMALEPRTFGAADEENHNYET